MAVVQLSPKGQVLIPKAIREKYGVKPGSNVHILEEPDSIIIKPALEDQIAAAYGFLEGDYFLTEDLIKEHREELKNERPHSPR